MFDKTQPAFQALRNIAAERTRQIVAFVGAGISVDAGLPSWHELKSELCGIARKTIEGLQNNQKLGALLEVAESESNYWLAFQHLKKIVGETTFRSETRRLLTPDPNSNIPEIYRKLWKLRKKGSFRGFLTLNLDGFAARAYSLEYPGSRLSEFSGRSTSGYEQAILSTGMPFVGNIHGVLENEKSWVFSKDDLDQLFQDSGYLRLIEVLLQTRTFIFTGLTVQDIAVGGVLERLKNKGISFAEHFWITHKATTDTHEWAEEVGLRVIKYSTASGDHAELDEAITELLTFIPVDEVLPPIIPKVVQGEFQLLPSPEELEKMDPETIRTTLNAAALKILSKGGEESVNEYERFRLNYSEAIWRAWSVNTGPRNNTLFGNRIVRLQGKGAFGKVYEALTPQGERVAVKVLHEFIREESQMIESFRRGVNSMRILADRNVPGMVPYRGAWEIPACAVMEFIDGPDLENAVEAKYLNEWTLVLEVSYQLAKILERAHSLPERVLHRDVRPANIMLKDWYSDSSKLEVVVLDFDLSWHRDAVGQSIDWSKSVSGYIAPELVLRHKKRSTRTAAVDSYGFGMTAYFLASGKHPVFMQHRNLDWDSNLKENIVRMECKRWRSLPRRFARLIWWATNEDENVRWDMSRIKGEIEQLIIAVKAPGSVNVADLLAEEVIANLSMVCPEYSWNDQDGNAISTTLASGAEVRLGGDQNTRRVKFSINWTSKGSSSFRQIGKYMNSAQNKANAILRSAGWISIGGRGDVKDASVYAEYDCDKLGGRMVEASKAVAEVVSLFKFQ